MANINIVRERRSVIKSWCKYCDAYESNFIQNDLDNVVLSDDETLGSYMLHKLLPRFMSKMHS